MSSLREPRRGGGGRKFLMAISLWFGFLLPFWAYAQAPNVPQIPGMTFLPD